MYFLETDRLLNKFHVVPAKIERVPKICADSPPPLHPLPPGGENRHHTFCMADKRKG